MRFSIITPTYKRPEFLLRATRSVVDQSYQDWEMIIVDDSPDFDYSTFEQEVIVKDKRIKYLKNTENKGVNFSRNRALDEVSDDTDFVLFLDDDDYLAADALTDLRANIEKYPGHDFYFSKRVFPNCKDLTIIPKFLTEYTYTKDILILKKVKYDFTAIVSNKLIKENAVRYSRKIKQAEELLFWHHVSKFTPLFALPLGITITDGYLSDGLTHNKDSKMQRLKQTIILYSEARERKILDTWFILYLCLRVGAILIK